MDSSPKVLRTVTAIRYALPLREGGSLPGLMEADDDGLYVVKFRGAGQGAAALVSEVFFGEIARSLGLPIPEIVLVDLDVDISAAEGDPEIQDLLRASAGLNLGIDFLPGAFPFAPPIARALAADIVWFDSLVMNVDRTAKNPNLLRWHNQVWVIDHGACLPAQHGDDPLSDAALREFPRIADHVLLKHAGSIADAHSRLAPLLSAEMIRDAAALVPDSWFIKHGREEYIDFVQKRLSSGQFAEEAERVRS